MIRKAILFLFSIALICAGAYVFSLFLRHPSLATLFRVGFGAVFLMALGAYLLWDDFLQPMIRQRSKN
jgi:arginine exporter protein ArgO